MPQSMYERAYKSLYPGDFDIVVSFPEALLGDVLELAMSPILAQEAAREGAFESYRAHLTQANTSPSMSVVVERRLRALPGRVGLSWRSG